MEKLENFNTSKEIIDYIKEKTNNSKDISYREISVNNEIVYIVFNEPLTDTKIISNYVIRSIKKIEKRLKKCEEENDINDKIEKKLEDNSLPKVIKKRKLSESSLENNINRNNKLNIYHIIDVLENSISISKVKKLDLKEDNLFYYLFSGFTCIIHNTDILVAETKSKLDRGVSEPKTEGSIKGPKDAFLENYSDNIGLIRKRIKSEDLILDEKIIGRRSKTKVGLMYISDIARPELVEYVSKKLDKIDIDAILDSNYISEFIEQSTKADFPTIFSTERPDLVCFYMLQGRVAIVVENSPFVLVLPVFIGDFINNIEDYYQKNNNVTFTKIIRYLAFIITIITPALYVALTTFDQESIPNDLLVSFAIQKKGVPFVAFIEAFLMIISFEILREGDYRVPSASGSTLSIVGALILGDAAVNAGIVSPIMIQSLAWQMHLEHGE